MRENPAEKRYIDKVIERGNFAEEVEKIRKALLRYAAEQYQRACKEENWILADWYLNEVEGFGK